MRFETRTYFTLSRGLLILLLLQVFPQWGRAQETESDDRLRNVNYAFATQVGSGIYSVNGQTIQIYRFEAVIRLLSTEGRSWGLRLRLPTTFGFYNFKFQDVLMSGLPDKLTTLALVPTLELDIPISERWWLGPEVGLGFGKDLSNGDSSVIYSLGVRSLAIFSWRQVDIRLGNRYVYAGYTDGRLNFVDDFAILETGLDFRHPLGLRIRGSHLDGSFFGVNYLYFISPQIVRQLPEVLQMHTDWELGVTLGTVEPWRILGVRMPRLGMSYRFGSGANAVRFIIGNPFPIDSPMDRSSETD